MSWEPSHWIEEEIVRLRRLLREHEEGYLAGTPTLSPSDYDRHLAMQQWLTHVYQTFNYLD